MNIFLSDILAAKKRLEGQSIRTPLRPSTWLAELSGAQVFLKLENLQVSGSFKFRGALNALRYLKEKNQPVVFTASSGNHGLGVAHAARLTETEVNICVPTNIVSEKRKRLEGFNLKLILHGTDCEVTEAYAQRMAGEKKAFYLSPYNNAEVIAGQGTVALEMLEDRPDLTTLVVAVGGGGLIGGIAVAAKAINPEIRIVGVVAANSPTMKEAVRLGRIAPVLVDHTLADGIAGNIDPDSITFPLAKELVDEWLEIEEKDIEETIFEFLQEEKMIIEGAAAVAVSAVRQKLISIKPNDKVGVVICGGNISTADWQKVCRDRLLSRV